MFLGPGRVPDRKQLETLSRARGILLPQSVHEQAWHRIKSLGRPLFPDYSHRFGFQGKTGNLRLFETLGLDHPKTRAYASPGEFLALFPECAPLPFSWPLVAKADQGGGGNGVFLAKSPRDLMRILRALSPEEPFVLQEFVDHRGADLRVVVIGEDYFPYWRVQVKKSEFRNNLCRGARIEKSRAPDLTGKGVELVRKLAEKSGLNLAAVDVLFDLSRKNPAPLLNEINWCFGRKGMGGSARFHPLLEKAVGKWTRSLS